MKKNDEPGRETLHMIAAALDVPVERFFNSEPSTKSIVGTDEYISLWSRITTEDGKRQALEALRAIVDMEQT